MVAQTAKEAIARADAYTRCSPGYCLRYVRTWLGIDSQQPRAIDAWDAAKVKHPGDRRPPAGVPMFYRSRPGSGSGAGHIVLSRGDGPMRGTDMPTGYVGNDDGSYPITHWGFTYLGWTEDLNGVTIPYLQDWRSVGAVYVEKLHLNQLESDSVARLRYRLQNHAEMPGSHAPGYGFGYGPEVVQAVRYWQTAIIDSHPGDPTDGSHLNNRQAHVLFGTNYSVVSA